MSPSLSTYFGAASKPRKPRKQWIAILHSCEVYLSECLDCLDFYLANSSAQVRGDAKQNSLSARVAATLVTGSYVEAEEQVSDYYYSVLM